MKLNKQTKDKLKLFNDSKILILLTLYNSEEVNCGVDLVEKLKMPKNLLSYHMKYLTERGYVQDKKCGKKKYYSVKNTKRDEVERILKIVEAI